MDRNKIQLDKNNKEQQMAFDLVKKTDKQSGMDVFGRHKENVQHR